jgi:hypothetical protein
VYDGASFRFRDDVAKALLDALLEHFHGGSGNRELRKDYDAERARVDKLMQAVIDRKPVVVVNPTEVHNA